VTALAKALRACASGILTAEAGVSMLIDCGGWLHRVDFTGPFITTGTGISDGTTLMASIDWPAAIAALDAGRLPCGSSERHMLRLAASIAGGVPVSLCDSLTSIDYQNANLLTAAVPHANGQPGIANPERHISLSSENMSGQVTGSTRCRTGWPGSRSPCGPTGPW